MFPVDGQIIYPLEEPYYATDPVGRSARSRVARWAAEEATTQMRVGIGFDVHRFDEGRRLILGGVELSAEQGLAGHSDADVLTHAVIDALLGAAALGDIGHHFPDTDERWRDASSLEMLRSVVGLLEADNYQPVNVDVALTLETPRLAPTLSQMRDSLAEALKIAPAQVSIKATTAEKLGAIGRGEGVAAWAVVLIDRVREPEFPRGAGGA